MANVSGSRAILAAPSHARAVRDDANAVADDGVLEVVEVEASAAPLPQERFWYGQGGLKMIRLGDRVITFSPDDDYDIRTPAEVYEFLAEMTLPFDGIELPDISALVQYDGFPDDVTETARPVNVFEKSHYSRKGKEIETTDDEAQTLVSGLASAGYGSCPDGDHYGDATTIYSHVPTPGGEDREIRALIFRSVRLDPEVSDRGAMACWATSTLLSSTVSAARSYRRDSDILVDTYVPIHDYVDAENAVKVFSVVIPDSVKGSELQHKQYNDLLSNVVVQWLEPDMEALERAEELERARKAAYNAERAERKAKATPKS